LRVVYTYERGENLGHERHWSLEIGIHLFEGHDAYCNALIGGTGRALPGVASQKSGVLVRRPAPGRFLGFIRCGPLS
jgi:hypothetical protein